jgi:hypothetical protein
LPRWRRVSSSGHGLDLGTVLLHLTITSVFTFNEEYQEYKKDMNHVTYAIFLCNFKCNTS